MKLTNILRCIALIFILLQLMVGLGHDFAPYSYILVILVNIFTVYKSRKNFPFLIVCAIILYSNYSIIYPNFVVVLDNYYIQPITAATSIVSLNILAVFNCLFLFIINWDTLPECKDFPEFIKHENKCMPLVFFTTLTLIYIFFYGFEIPQVIGMRGKPLPIYEYSLLLFIMYFYFSGNDKRATYVGIFLVLCYSLQDFIFGGRIMGLQFLLCLYIIIYSKKISIKTTLVIGGSLFLLFSLIGVLRGALLSSNFDISSMVVELFRGGFALDTAYSAYHTSQAFVYSREMIPDTEISRYAEIFIKSIFIGESSNRDATLSNISYEYAQHSSGGLFPYYFYFYFGVIGMVLSIFIVRFYYNTIKTISEQSGGLKKCFAIFFICYTFRWYLYTPLGLLRTALFLVAIYYLYNFIYKLYKFRKLNL